MRWQVHALERTKGALHLAQELVAANRVVGVHLLLGKAGTYHIDTVERSIAAIGMLSVTELARAAATNGAGRTWSSSAAWAKMAAAGTHRIRK